MSKQTVNGAAASDRRDQPRGQLDAMERSSELVDEMDAIADRCEAAITELGGLNQELADEFMRIFDTSSSESEADRLVEGARIEILWLMDAKRAEIARLHNDYKRIEIEYKRLQLQYF